MGDGCNMEGISTEAASLAGHWGLGKLIALYDDNGISIDGHTDISFTEDVSARYEALGWHVQHVKVRRAVVYGEWGGMGWESTKAAAVEEEAEATDALTAMLSSPPPPTHALTHARTTTNNAHHPQDGNTDFESLRKAIAAAKAVTDKPSLIKVTTLIGYGSPNRADTHDVHGAPLGAEETAATRANLKWEYPEFEVPKVRHRGRRWW